MSKTRRRLMRWHRRIGVASAAFIIWMVATGLLLNHAHQLGLDEPVDAPWLAHQLGLSAACDRHWPAVGITDCTTAVYLGTQRVDGVQGPLAGAVHWEGMLALAGPDGLTLLLPDGQRVEQIPPGMLPGAPGRMGRDGDRLLLITGAGAFSSDAALTQWLPAREPVTVEASTPPPALAADLEAATATAQLSASRLLLELHSGRIGGPLGVLLVDLTGAALLALAVLGLWLTWRLHHTHTSSPARGSSWRKAR